MIIKKTHISVCICTYKRPELLRKLLLALGEQVTDGLFSYSVVVADNDKEETARKIVELFKINKDICISYHTEPRRNIALVRNKVVEKATGDFLAFIDDDELPENTWLFHLYSAIEKYQVDAILAPVRPRFEHIPPSWVEKGHFFKRPEYQTGRLMKFGECRTGNVLIRKRSIDCLDIPFDEKYESGSEDVDFFRRFINHGKTVIWCNEAPVYELVPPQRCTRKYLLRLALLRGGNSFKHKEGRIKGVTKAFLAIPLYFLALPFLYIVGEQYFLKYLVKLCDHFGRLTKAFGITIIRERTM